MRSKANRSVSKRDHLPVPIMVLVVGVLNQPVRLRAVTYDPMVIDRGKENNRLSVGRKAGSAEKCYQNRVDAAHAAKMCCREKHVERKGKRKGLWGDEKI